MYRFFSHSQLPSKQQVQKIHHYIAIRNDDDDTLFSYRKNSNLFYLDFILFVHHAPFFTYARKHIILMAEMHTFFAPKNVCTT